MWLLPLLPRYRNASVVDLPGVSTVPLGDTPGHVLSPDPRHRRRRSRSAPEARHRRRRRRRRRRRTKNAAKWLARRRCWRRVRYCGTAVRRVRYGGVRQCATVPAVCGEHGDHSHQAGRVINEHARRRPALCGRRGRAPHPGVSGPLPSDTSDRQTDR